MNFRHLIKAVLTASLLTMVVSTTSVFADTEQSTFTASTFAQQYKQSNPAQPYSVSDYAQAPNIKVTFNGATLTLKDTDGSIMHAYTSSGRTFLPLRAVGSAISATINWDSTHQIAQIEANGNTVETWAGSQVVIVNGSTVQQIDNNTALCAYTSDGRTYLPLRAVLEGLGYTVNWNATTQTVEITTKTQTTNPSGKHGYTDATGKYWESIEDYYNSKDPNITGVNKGEAKPTTKGTAEGQKSPQGHWLWDLGEWIPITPSKN